MSHVTPVCRSPHHDDAPGLHYQSISKSAVLSLLPTGIRAALDQLALSGCYVGLPQPGDVPMGAACQIHAPISGLNSLLEAMSASATTATTTLICSVSK